MPVDTLNTKLCPLCGGHNNCMADSEKPCWCIDVKVPQKLRDLVPLDKKDLACICLKCVESYNKTIV